MGLTDFVALGVLLLGVLATVLVVRVGDDRDRENVQRRARAEAAGATERAVTEGKRYAAAIVGTSAAFAVSSDGVSRDGFQAYLNTISSTATGFPGVKGVGYVARVNGADLDGWLARTRADGAPDYTVTPPSAERELAPVLYSVPRATGFPGEGADLLRDPRIAPTVQRAAETNGPQVSLPVQFDAGADPLLLLVAPVYQAHNGQVVQGGWGLMFLDPAGLTNAMALDSANFSVEVRDVQTGTLISASPTSAASPDRSVSVQRARITLVDRPVEITYRPLSGVRAAVIDPNASYRILVLGLMCSVLAAGTVLILGRLLARRRREAELTFRATHDPLTGLPNRALAEERLRAACRTRRGSGQLALMFVDLDGFKAINDGLGHDVGDAALAAVAERLRASVRATDTVARYGGDEFVVLADGMKDEDEATAFAERIVTRLSAPLELGEESVRIGASVGIALTRGGNNDSDELVRRADAAMYRAKAIGRGVVQVYESEPTIAGPLPTT